MHIAIEHENNFPITASYYRMKQCGNGNGDICIHTENPSRTIFSCSIYIYIYEEKTKIRTCQMDIIRICRLLGFEKSSFSRASHRIFMTFRLFRSTLDRNGF